MTTTLVPQKNLKVSLLRPSKNTETLTKIRRSLPGQALLIDGTKNLSLAQTQFGLVYTRAALNQRVLATIPATETKRIQERRRRSGWMGAIRLSVKWQSIDRYAELIPDTALLRYKTALDSGLFSSFHVLDIEQKRITLAPRFKDPWLVGSVKSGGDAHVVLAYWDPLDAVVAKRK